MTFCTTSEANYSILLTLPICLILRSRSLRNSRMIIIIIAGRRGIIIVISFLDIIRTIFRCLWLLLRGNNLLDFLELESCFTEFWVASWIQTRLMKTTNFIIETSLLEFQIDFHSFSSCPCTNFAWVRTRYSTSNIFREENCPIALWIISASNKRSIACFAILDADWLRAARTRIKWHFFISSCKWAVFIQAFIASHLNTWKHRIVRAIPVWSLLFDLIWWFIIALWT